MDKKVEHVTWLEKQKHKMSGFVNSAKDAMFHKHNKT